MDNFSLGEQVNIKFSRENTPAGTRFLYRNDSNRLIEGTVREWAKSGQYLNFDGQWTTIEGIEKYTIVEILPKDSLWEEK